MYRILYFIINLIARIHARLLSINDNRGLGLTDKQLHFLIIGVFGFAMMMVVQPVFEWLTKHNATLIVSFLYVLTVVTVVSFSIEVGQYFTGTGTMDIYDIASGMLGFFVAFAVYMILYLIYKGIKSSLSSGKEEEKK